MRRVTANTANRAPRWQTVALAAGAALLAAACGSSGGLYGGSSPSPTSAAPTSAAPAASPTSALCQQAADLRASIHTLTDVTVGQGMGDEIKSDLADVRSKLNSFKAQAPGQWQSQT